jgi:hypothetical protein
MSAVWCAHDVNRSGSPLVVGFARFQPGLFPIRLLHRRRSDDDEPPCGRPDNDDQPQSLAWRRPGDVIYRSIRRGLTEFAARAGVTDLGDDDRLVDAPMTRWSPNI